MSGPVAVNHAVEGPPGAPALVLANSLGTSLAMWDPQVRALAARYRVVRYDQRGHGASPVPPGPYASADLGLDLLALLDRLGIDRAHVCGLSLGGMTAMWVAAHAPGRVDRLVLCCTSAWLDRDAYARRAVQVRARGMESVVDAVLGRWFTPAFGARDPERLAALRQMLVTTPVEGYAGCCEAIATLDLENRLPAIAARTLVVGAAADAAIPAGHAERLAAAIPGSRLRVVPGAGHLANIEQPEAVTALILEHLGREQVEEPR